MLTSIRAFSVTLPSLLCAVVAAGLVGYIAYKVYTGEGKHSPMSTIGMLFVVHQ